MAAGCEGGSWSVIENTWTLWHYERMMDVWNKHGAPPFVSLAAMAGHKPETPSGKKESTENKKFGTMEDLAMALGAGGSNSKAFF